MLSDIENLDIMLGENHFNARDKDGSLNSNLPRRSGSFISNESENDEMKRAHIEIKKLSTLLPVPILTVTQLLLIQVLKSIDCQVS